MRQAAATRRAQGRAAGGAGAAGGWAAGSRHRACPCPFQLGASSRPGSPWQATW